MRENSIFTLLILENSKLRFRGLKFFLKIYQIYSTPESIWLKSRRRSSLEELRLCSVSSPRELAGSSITLHEYFEKSLLNLSI